MGYDLLPPAQSDLQIFPIPFLFQEDYGANAAFVLFEQPISNPSWPLLEMHVTGRISPPLPAPLPMLHPKISVLYSNDPNFSYCFLLDESRQLFPQGFAYNLQIPPQTVAQQVTKEMPRRRAPVIRVSAPNPIKMLGKGWGWSAVVFSST